MKKKQLLCLFVFTLLALLIPNSVSAKEVTTEKVICKYNYKEELTYKIYANEVVVPFEDGENNWYHSQDFKEIYLESAKVNSINYVCPTITIEESDSFTTVFNNPKNEEDCNGKCTTLVATEVIANENITATKAVATTAISSVGIYDDVKYFIPYFRLLEDGTKEWSLNGKKYISVNSSAILTVAENTKALIRLDEKLIQEIYKDNTLNSSLTIYRNVRKINENYEYLLSTEKEDNYNLTDGQETSAASYHTSYGDNTQNMDDWLDDYDQPQSCSGNGSILGSYDDPKSVAWLLQKIFNYIKVIGPLIVVIMSGIDFAKVIVMGDDDGMKKAQSKLMIRLILAASLFVLPDLVSALLELFGITSSGICGLE